MSTEHGKFGTALECMDGRTQRAVSDFVIKKFQVDYVDTITEAGIDGKLGSDTMDENLLASLEAKIGISVKGHGSRNIVIAGHENCAGNPVDYDTHLDHLSKAAERVRNLGVVTENKVRVVTVFVAFEDKAWIVKEIH